VALLYHHVWNPETLYRVCGFGVKYGIVGIGAIREMSIPATITLVLMLQASNSPGKASIEGAVVRAGSHDPIAHVEVFARVVDAPDPRPPATTDSQGHFLIPDLEPGTYTLSAERNGFATQMYGQRSPHGPHTVLSLAAGQEMKGLVFPLVPPGAISGRVTDETREPLVGVSIQIMRAAYDDNGTKRYYGEKSVQTDDRGEYRAFLLSPGRYYMHAIPQFSYNRRLMNPNFVGAYYPGARVSSDAAAIDVAPGAEVTGIDLILQKQRLLSLHGRLVDSRTGKPPATPPSFQLYRRDSNNDNAPYGSADYNETTGTFALLNIPPGPYWVVARLNLMRVEDQYRPRLDTRTARIPVDLSDSDVDNIVIQFAPDVSIPGRIYADVGSPAAGQPDLSQFIVRLSPKDKSGIAGSQFEAHARADGTFLVENVQPGDYELWLLTPRAEYYIKTARLEGNDVQNNFRISGPLSEEIQVTVGSDTAHVAGTLVDKDRKPVAGIDVVLIPDYARDRHDLYRTGTTDQSGHFTLLPVVPGEYKLFAWEDLDRFLYMDPEFLRRYEDLGTRATIPASSTLDVEVKIIPGAQQ
jgi:hypothetical protein